MLIDILKRLKYSEQFLSDKIRVRFDTPDSDVAHSGNSTRVEWKQRLSCKVENRVRYIHPVSGDHSVSVPPDPISNSEVKRVRADDSVGPPHVKVGHRRV